MKNIAIILAGGSGSRLGNETPKQFLKVAGKQVIEHTLAVFDGAARIDEICIISRVDYVEEVEALVNRNQFTKVKKILVGGKERYESSLTAIRAYTDDSDNLIFHDAVRPLVNERIINDCIDALEHYNAVDVAVPTTDTVVAINPETGCIESIPNRAVLRNGQTPQCFKRGVIRRAYELALNDPKFVTTDDCGTVKRYLPDEPIFVVNGENFNMKITYVEDLYLLDRLFQLRTLHGTQKRLVPQAEKGLSKRVIVVFGGSQGIGAEIVRICKEHKCRVYSFSRTNGVDVNDMQAVEKALHDVNEEQGRIDAVINTAGVLIRKPLNNMEDEDIVESVNTNLNGVVNVARASFPYLRESHGALLFYTSSSYTRGRMFYSLYSATKAAIVNFTQAIADEWGDCNIRVNCINPERTKTPMRVQNFGNEPDGTLLPPEDVAIASLNVIFSTATGEVIDVRRHREE